MDGVYDSKAKGAPQGVETGVVVVDPKGTRYITRPDGKLLGGHKLPLERLHPNIILALLVFFEEERKGNYPPLNSDGV